MIRRKDPIGMRATELTWVVHWRFLVSASWGSTQQELAVEVPALWDNPDASRKLGLFVWTNALATASSRDLHLDAIQTMCWHGAAMPYMDFYTDIKGVSFGQSTDRSAAGVLSLMTGHPDGEGRRRLFLPSMPTAWEDGHLLTVRGAEELQALARGLYLGFGADIIGGPMRWVNVYPRMFEEGPLGTSDTGFRFVTSVRVCQFTERAPAPGSATWPG